MQAIRQEMPLKTTGAVSTGILSCEIFTRENKAKNCVLCKDSNGAVGSVALQGEN